MTEQWVVEEELSDYGLAPELVRRRFPQAVEYTALDGSACWFREALDESVEWEGGAA